MTDKHHVPARVSLSQQRRLVAALAYFAILLVLARYLNGTFWPPYGLAGLWFYSAGAALVLGEFLLEPFFTRPADALASAVTVLVAAATASLSGSQISAHAARTGRDVVLGLAIALIALAILAIALKDAGGAAGVTAKWATTVVGTLGRARWLFSGLLLAAGYAAFAHDAGKVATLYLAWFAVLVLEPIDVALIRLRSRTPSRQWDGIVEAIDDPGLVLCRFREGTDAKLGSSVEFSDGAAVGTVVDITRLSQEPRARVALRNGRPVRVGSRVALRVVDDVTSAIVGHVSEGTTLSEVKVGAMAGSAGRVGLEEGHPVSVEVNGLDALYQIVEAEVVAAGRTEASLQRHMVRITARKLGRWDPERTRFEPVGWVPDPGTPVLALPPKDGQDSFQESSVGVVPGTAYGISVDPHLAVTHNTAILGILGIGKTHLAWELIHRMLASGIKVIVLDITGRYADHFSSVCSPDAEAAIAESISSRIATDAQNRQVRNDEAGNVREFELAVNDVLNAFIASDGRLLIINPNRFVVTRMEGRPFSGQANFMVSLTMVEVTRIIVEAALALVQARPRDPSDDRAALCAVFEEAHSLIPEWNSAASDGEQQAVNGTARAILQGRKYGFGASW
jgi:hypothetical protein